MGEIEFYHREWIELNAGRFFLVVHDLKELEVGRKTQRHSRLKLYTIKLFDGESWSVEKTFYKCQGIVFIIMGSVYSSEYMQNVKNNLGIFVYMLRLSMSANDVSWVTLLGFSPKVKAAIDIISIHIVLNWTQILVFFFLISNSQVNAEFCFLASAWCISNLSRHNFHDNVDVAFCRFLFVKKLLLSVYHQHPDHLYLFSKKNTRCFKKYQIVEHSASAWKTRKMTTALWKPEKNLEFFILGKMVGNLEINGQTTSAWFFASCLII